jgi:hypothetical protein
VTAEELEERMNDMYEAAGAHMSNAHYDLAPRWLDCDAISQRTILRLFIVAFVGACQQIDALTAERDEAREQFVKIGRKAFWASSQRTGR